MFSPISANPNTQNDSQTELFSLSSFLIGKNFLIGFLFLLSSSLHTLGLNTETGVISQISYFRDISQIMGSFYA